MAAPRNKILRDTNTTGTQIGGVDYVAAAGAIRYPKKIPEMTDNGTVLGLNNIYLLNTCAIKVQYFNYYPLMC